MTIDKTGGACARACAGTEGVYIVVDLATLPFDVSVFLVGNSSLDELAVAGGGARAPGA